MYNSVGVSDFVIKRHLPYHQFTHYNGSWDELAQKTQAQINIGNFSQGYRDGVIVVHMPKAEVGNFFGYDGFQKFEGMRITADFEKVPGREHEPAKLQVKILEPKIRCRYVDIICYRKDVLEEDDENITGHDWDIVSINGRLHKDAPPMDPLTIVRNWKHLPGGTEMKDRTSEEVLEMLCDAILYKNGFKK